jgi:hypothetical protein
MVTILLRPSRRFQERPFLNTPMYRNGSFTAARPITCRLPCASVTEHTFHVHVTRHRETPAERRDSLRLYRAIQ